jgi:hypothetical protein
MLLGSFYQSTPAPVSASTARFDCASYAAGYFAGFCADRGQRVLACGVTKCSGNQTTPLQIEVVCG